MHPRRGEAALPPRQAFPSTASGAASPLPRSGHVRSAATRPNGRNPLAGIEVVESFHHDRWLSLAKPAVRWLSLAKPTLLQANFVDKLMKLPILVHP